MVQPFSTWVLRCHLLIHVRLFYPRELHSLMGSDEDASSSKIHGILGVHVDDGLGGGDQIFKETIAKLEARFPFGNKRQGSFIYVHWHTD